MLCGEAWRVPEEGSIDLVVAGTLRNEMLLVATTLLLKSLRTEASIIKIIIIKRASTFDIQHSTRKNFFSISATAHFLFRQGGVSSSRL